MKRLFLALDFPDPIKETLLSFQPKPGGGLRPVSGAQLHLTLCFIGLADREQVHQALSRALPIPGFSLLIKGLGRSPLSRGCVLWAGVAPCEALGALRQRLLMALRRAGIPVKSKGFRPHVTLARCRPGVSWYKIERFLEQGDRLELGPICVREFVLFSSDTRPEGAVYQIEHIYPLLREDRHRPP